MFYHLSKKHLGNDMIFEPRLPDSALIKTEGNIPRICVSSDIFLCIRSIISSKNVKIIDLLYEFSDRGENDICFEEWKNKNGFFINPSIYTTDETPFIPPDVSDFRYNKEHWFLNKTQFKFIGFLDISYLFMNEIKITDKQFTINYNDYKLLNYDDNYIIKPSHLVNHEIKKIKL